MRTFINPRQALPHSLQEAPQAPTAEQLQQFQQELQNNPELQRKLQEQLQANPELQRQLEQQLQQLQQAQPGGLQAGQHPSQQVQQQDPRQALLAQMHDVEDYGAVGWWPPAPGWWFIGILILIMLGLAVRMVWRRAMRGRYRKHALQELRKIKQASAPQAQAHALMQLIKRTFFTAYPNSRHQCAGLHGQPWLNLLEKTSRKPLTHDLLQQLQLDALLYGQTSATNDNSDTQSIAQLFTLTEQWIKHHHANSSKSQALINEALTSHRDSKLEVSHA